MGLFERSGMKRNREVSMASAEECKYLNLLLLLPRPRPVSCWLGDIELTHENAYFASIRDGGISGIVYGDSDNCLQKRSMFKHCLSGPREDEKGRKPIEIKFTFLF